MSEIVLSAAGARIQPGDPIVLCGLVVLVGGLALVVRLVVRWVRGAGRRLRRLDLSAWNPIRRAQSVKTDRPSSLESRDAGQPRRWWRLDRMRLVAGLAGVAAALVVGGWVGLVVGVVAAVAADRWVRRLEPRAVRVARLRAQADLPFALDLMAATLLAGAPPSGACVAVGEALGGPLGERLSRVGRALALGTPTAEAWHAVRDLPSGGRLAATAVRASRSGAAFGGALVRLAADLRAVRLAELESAGQRAGVLVVLPLGLCFLPAFVLGGLVPVVISMLGRVLP
jgi:Flp pilus assembly protein TadB